ncbi:MAG: flagellar hook-associated protein FlgK [Lachnospiraceae bacterium]|nr:flagellar hook-associated protein FlgK [Lachnospiraceae bacterium]
MANGFGSLYVGSMGLRGAQNALNVVANNLSNVDTTGYVRQQVIFQDVEYNKFASAAINDQTLGLGVQIGDVIHARDMFLDRAYRTENGRQKFYEANYEAVTEVETLLREGDGEGFATSIADLYEAFSEFSKAPDGEVYQNLVAQNSQLFLSRTQGLYAGFKSYQTDINTKIRNDVNRINEIGEEIHKLNTGIQRIEAAGVETAMDLRDARDQLLDELAGLARMEYKETDEGIVKVKIEGTDFVTEVQSNHIGLKEDSTTGFVTPYWEQLSEPKKDRYYEVFDISDIRSEFNNDVGEVKALLLARGDNYKTYIDMQGLSSNILTYDTANDQYVYNRVTVPGLSSKVYDKTLGSSTMMNMESELDAMMHQLAVSINDLLSPLDTMENVYDTATYGNIYDANGQTTALDPWGKTVILNKDTKVCDIKNCCVGSDGGIPPHELFTRIGCDRYTEMKLNVTNYVTGQPETISIYVYNEEDPTDTSKCYTLSSMVINEDVADDPSLIPHQHQKSDNKGVAYDMAEDIYALWENEDYMLNPSDVTPTTFAGFYTKLVGELANVGSVYKTTAESLDLTRDTIEASRQGVTGVSSDEELSDMIKYQNAFNASSRYMNVVSEMIEHLISQL